MATLQETFNHLSDPNLRNRVEAAIWLSVKEVITEDPMTDLHAERILWATSVVANPRQMAERMLPAVVILDPDATFTDDTVISSAVSALVNKFAQFEA